MIRIGKYSVLLLTITALSLILPLAYSFIFSPFVPGTFLAYSTIKDEILVQERGIRSNTYTKANGEQISRDEYFEWLPMLYYKKLSATGKLRDSIKNEPISLLNLRKHNFIHKMNANVTQKPTLLSAPVFESSSKATQFSYDSLFYIFKDSILIMNLLSEEINHSLTQRFNKQLKNKGFRFPIKKAFGYINNKKFVDAGYYLIDDNNGIYTLKSYAYHPDFLKLQLPQMEIKHIEILDPVNGEIMAIIIDRFNRILLHMGLSNAVVDTEIKDYNFDNDNILLTNTLFNKSITLENNRRVKIYVLNNDIELLKSHTINFKVGEYKAYDFIYSLVFPFELSIHWKKSAIKKLKLKENYTWHTLAFNILLVLAVVIFIKPKKRLEQVLIILITGLYGLIALLIYKD